MMHDNLKVLLKTNLHKNIEIMKRENFEFNLHIFHFIHSMLLKFNPFDTKYRQSVDFT